MEKENISKYNEISSSLKSTIQNEEIFLKNLNKLKELNNYFFIDFEICKNHIDIDFFKKENRRTLVQIGKS